MSQAKSSKAPISPNRLYSASVLISDLGISKNTLIKWKELGLKYVDGANLGTRADYYWSDDVLSFIRSRGTGNDSKAG